MSAQQELARILLECMERIRALEKVVADQKLIPLKYVYDKDGFPNLVVDIGLPDDGARNLDGTGLTWKQK